MRFIALQKKTRAAKGETMAIPAIALFISVSAAFAAGPCGRASRTLTPAQRKMYARSISSNLSNWKPPAQVSIDKALTLKNWTAVWATPKGSEQGIFFYSEEKSGLRFHDTWSGYATPSEKPDIVRWVKKLSASVPDDFAECFAETVTAGH